MYLNICEQFFPRNESEHSHARPPSYNSQESSVERFDGRIG